MPQACPRSSSPLFALDQRINAEHVAAVGAGLNLDGGPAAVDAVPDAVAQVLAGTSHRGAARGVANELATLPPVDDAVTILKLIAAR